MNKEKKADSKEAPEALESTKALQTFGAACRFLLKEGTSMRDMVNIMNPCGPKGSHLV